MRQTVEPKEPNEAVQIDFLGPNIYLNESKNMLL